jgi:hypothetical protein
VVLERHQYDRRMVRIQLRSRTSFGQEEEEFKTNKLGGCNATMTELWNAALAA